MQRRVGDHHAADGDRLEPRHRGQGAGAADLDIDGQDARLSLLGGEFMGDGPARRAADHAQESINRKDVGLKGFLPAIFARLVTEKFGANTGGKATLKLTAPKKLVRNRANRPDKWEHNVIEKQFKSAGYPKGKHVTEDTTFKGKDAFRLILPEYYGKSCLGCHGKPKGERDITGGKKEGGVLGQLGGAISVVILK